jgi:phosphatidylglycerophosphate synthase
MPDLVRDHRSVLARAEKRLLVAIAAQLPPPITSDHLTLLAFASMVLAGLGYGLALRDRAWLFVSIVALALNWFGDSLDGTLARVRRLERPRYGFYVDHVVDILGITAVLAGLACSGFMSPVIALALLIAYLLVSGEVFLATSVHGVFRMSFAGVGPTELRILLAVGTLALRHDPHVAGVRLFDVGGVVAIAGLAIALAVSIWRNALALARLEPPRQRSRPVPLEPVEPSSTMIHLSSRQNSSHGEPRYPEAGTQPAGGAWRAHP